MKPTFNLLIKKKSVLLSPEKLDKCT